MNKQTKGFTIIEVVLVLAIAGLIFLMVFLALPALQRSQRDTQRRSSVAHFVAMIAQYQSNNQGALPTNSEGTCSGPASKSADCFVQKYVTSSWTDPSQGEPYRARYVEDPLLEHGDWKYALNRKCVGDTPNSADSGGATKYVIQMKLEAGFVCMDNQ